MISSEASSINRQNDPRDVALPESSYLAPHLVVFIACFCFLAGALILVPAEPGTHHLQLGGVPMPQTCIFRNLTGIPCPGCGLSRSVVAAMHGDVVMSFAYHRLGLLTLVYIFFQFVYRLGLIVIPKWRTRIFQSGKFLNIGIIVLGILFMLNWILTLVPLGTFPEVPP